MDNLERTGGNSSRYRFIYGNYSSKSIREAADKIPSKQISKIVSQEMDDEVKRIT